MNYCLVCGAPARFLPYSHGSRVVDGELRHTSTRRLSCERFPLHQTTPVIRPGAVGVEVVPHDERFIRS